MPVSGMFLSLGMETLESRIKIEIHSIWSSYKCIIFKTLTSDKYTFFFRFYVIYNNFIKRYNI